MKNKKSLEKNQSHLKNTFKCFEVQINSLTPGKADQVHIFVFKPRAISQAILEGRTMHKNEHK